MREGGGHNGINGAWDSSIFLGLWITPFFYFDSGIWYWCFLYFSTHKHSIKSLFLGVWPRATRWSQSSEYFFCCCCSGLVDFKFNYCVLHQIWIPNECGQRTQNQRNYVKKGIYCTYLIVIGIFIVMYPRFIQKHIFSHFCRLMLLWKEKYSKAQTAIWDFILALKACVKCILHVCACKMYASLKQSSRILN